MVEDAGKEASGYGQMRRRRVRLPRVAELLAPRVGRFHPPVNLFDQHGNQVSHTNRSSCLSEHGEDVTLACLFA